MSFSSIGRRFVGDICQNLESQCPKYNRWDTHAMRTFMLSRTAGLSTHIPRQALRPASSLSLFFSTCALFTPTFQSRSTTVVPWLLQTQIHAIFVRGKNTLKTNKSIAKRLRPRGNRTLKRNKSGKSHNTGYKTRMRTNRLGQSTIVKERKMEKKMQRCLGLY